ncbi:MAG: MAPEG family protein [Pseudomonadota bacterium]
MNPEAIFTPMLGLMALTAVVWVYLYLLRIPAMKKARKPVQTYTTPDTVIDALPPEANYPANNFKNLFELPVLFYALCLYLYVTGNVDAVHVYAAWAFFAFRVAHSVVHCTFNRVIVRFWLYCGGAVALFLMLFRALLDAV